MRRIFMTADWFLGSLGIAMLSLSLMLVPISGLLADTGGPLVPVPTTCLASDGCNTGCTRASTGQCDPSSGYSGCNGAGCSSCPCLGCKPAGANWFCACQCQSSDSGCADSSTCKPNTF